jgi:hypothetical protein
MAMHYSRGVVTQAADGNADENSIVNTKFARYELVPVCMNVSWPQK